MDSFSQATRDEQGNTVVEDTVDNLHFVSLCPSNGNLPLDISNELTDDINQNIRLEEAPGPVNQSDTLSQRNTNRRAILLGRGNSCFTQGRSEVIFLNDAKQNLMGNSQVVGNGMENVYTSHGSAPPPVSKCAAAGKATGDVRSAKSGENFDKLEKLWHKVESIMLAKQGVVQQVLEECGIGEAGDEDESVWQVLQDNFQV